MNRSKVYKNILILPDMHFPWVNWKALTQAKRWADRHKPELVIQLGDLTDQKIWSNWQSDPDDPCPSEEFDQAQKGLEKLHDWFPEMVILRGNHDERILKRAVEAGIPGKMFKDVDEVFAFDGWEWISRKDKLIVKTERGPVLFQHGDEMGGNVSAKSRMLGMSIVQGHTHKTSITYTQTPKGHFFGAELGCLMDVDSKAARYAQANPVGVSVGFGVLKHGVPYFVSYEKGKKV
jgi:predicted phosphodiesterase